MKKTYIKPIAHCFVINAKACLCQASGEFIEPKRKKLFEEEYDEDEGQW